MSTPGRLLGLLFQLQGAVQVPAGQERVFDVEAGGESAPQLGILAVCGRQASSCPYRDDLRAASDAAERALCWRRRAQTPPKSHTAPAPDLTPGALAAASLRTSVGRLAACPARSHAHSHLCLALTSGPARSAVDRPPHPIPSPSSPGCLARPLPALRRHASPLPTDT